MDFEQIINFLNRLLPIGVVCLILWAVYIALFNYSTLYRIRRFLDASLSHWTLNFFIPGLFGLYLAAYDIQGDKWSFFRDNTELHSGILKISIVIAIIFIFIRGINSKLNERAQEELTNFFILFITSTASVVHNKIDHFNKKAKSLLRTGDTFKAISDPESQIERILAETTKLLMSFFALKESQLSITIIRFNGHDQKAFFLHSTNKSWDQSRTKPKVLIDNESTARDCLSTGEARFHPEKKIAAEKKQYYITERDKRSQCVGSIYAYPVFVRTPDYEDKYIVCISTYGKLLCRHHDIEQVESISIILGEICRRLQLELTLYSIHWWKYQAQARKSSSVSTTEGA